MPVRVPSSVEGFVQFGGCPFSREDDIQSTLVAMFEVAFMMW